MWHGSCVRTTQRRLAYTGMEDVNGGGAGGWCSHQRPGGQHTAFLCQV